MGHQVEAGPERIRHHVRRPHHTERNLTMPRSRSTVDRTVPAVLPGRAHGQRRACLDRRVAWEGCLGDEGTGGMASFGDVTLGAKLRGLLPKGALSHRPVPRGSAPRWCRSEKR
jgi:hypothetical protein